MSRTMTYGLGALCGVGVVATLDSALGLGGGAFIADVCRTWLEDEPAGGRMARMDMDVKPVPLLAISLAATGAAIWAMTQEHHKAVAGRSEPDDEERAAILSAMLIMAVAQGRVSRDEIADVFRIVTFHELNEELLDLVMTRFRVMQDEGAHRYPMQTVSSPIGRRRALSAALIVGCIARPATQRVSALIEELALDIGASESDISVAHAALEAWQEGLVSIEGISPVTLLRHRNLQLTPA